MSAFLPFEKGLAELEGQIAELRANAQAEEGLEIEAEIRQLEKRVEARLDEIYGRLTPWQRCQIARHPRRPHSTDFAAALFEEFLPLAGDRAFAEDFAIIGGLVRFRGRSAVFIGQEKGRDTESRIQRNFGMARPEGYRKAIRLMDLADRFRLPVITSIDTPGAYPGRGAEERGQAEAIARTVEKGLGLGVPSIAVILGEGGSGGAVALATANRVLMLEHAVYSVISPEGCASILWRDSEKAESAAAALRLTASDLLRLGAIDRIVKEPRGERTGVRMQRCGWLARRSPRKSTCWMARSRTRYAGSAARNSLPWARRKSSLNTHCIEIVRRRRRSERPARPG